MVIFKWVANRIEEQRKEIKEKEDKEREKWEQREREEEEKNKIKYYLENGGLELKVRELIKEKLIDDKIYGRTFRINKDKVGILFEYDDYFDVSPFAKNYYHGAFGMLLKNNGNGIEHRIVGLKRTIYSGGPNSVGSFWDVNNESKYDLYKQIPDLMSDGEIEKVWKYIQNRLPEYDDF